MDMAGVRACKTEELAASMGRVAANIHDSKSVRGSKSVRNISSLLSLLLSL